ncbi:MAG: tetratricopeptide repeat protein [bacterium]
MPNNRLSVCMIVKNESRNLPTAIESVRSIADEIVVVDTGSTDESPEVARRLGARVIEHPWNGDFSSARNAAIDEARFEWILFLDADETVDKTSYEEIRNAINGDADAYFVSIESRVRAKTGKIFVNTFPRLFRRIDGVRFEGRVHEQILPSLERCGARVKASTIMINHSGYDLPKEKLEAKLKRNLELLLQDLRSDPSNVTTLFHLGETYTLLGDYQRAAKYYRLALSEKDFPPEVKAVIHQNLASALIKLGKYEEALREVSTALRLDHTLLSARLVKASALFGGKRYNDAEKEITQYIREAEKKKRTAVFRLDFAPDISSALVLIARCRIAKGDWKGAESYLKESLRTGRNPDANILLGRLAFEQMRFADAVIYFKEAVKICGDDEVLYFELAKAYVACGAVNEAVEVMEKARGTIQVSPAFLKCLGLLRIKVGDFTGAIKQLEEVLKMDPSDEDVRRKLAGLYHKVGQTSVALEILSQ